ncbi:hypothetical protein CVU83_00835 [Candidatus Falkowbacteria bacterium HGW-Falkowbacteria-2]|uniref:Polysaccharide chain length determinant N-terminal domain-containing protein n=1 Tax=Candidatus Falkowbacteria bacterium HGW-Falkowbacteria-2 TaxID=2013769 RepID=A0A2N2E2M2_9BACT|nr:MAG: hypothetical protein CVU83_00835 [Candidatus Falkowbacteria bacterium HGW-Falkowbacteria-2]
MELNTFFHSIKKRQGLVAGIVLGCFILVFGLTFIQPLKYSVRSRLLISQNLSGADPYTVSKSNQYLSNLFSQVVYSSSFFNLATDAGYNIDTAYFGDTYKKRMKSWKKTIDARSIGDTGIMEIYIYHADTYQAQQIALAVNQTLMSKSFNYQRGGDQVSIAVIDQPLTSSFPVKPNIILNFFAAIFLGVAAASFWIYFFPERKKTHKPKKRDTLIYQPIPTEAAREVYPPAQAPDNLPTSDDRPDNSMPRNNWQPQGSIHNILR